MPNILMTRIDNRPVHGGGRDWTNTLGANGGGGQRRGGRRSGAAEPDGHGGGGRGADPLLHAAENHRRDPQGGGSAEDFSGVQNAAGRVDAGARRGADPVRQRRQYALRRGKRQVHKTVSLDDGDVARFARWRRWAWSAKCAGYRMRRARRSANCSFEPGKAC